jgi:hypothetical protein
VPAVDQCHQCGFEYDLGRAQEAGPAIVAGTAELAALLQIESALDLRSRWHPDVWSPLEYACHVRDLLLVQRERVLLARRADRPALTPMGRDERVEHDGYADQHPDDVARQVADAARLFANVLHRLGPADWERTVVYGYPAPAERSLGWVAVHTLHEVRHHLGDVRQQLT